MSKRAGIFCDHCNTMVSEGFIFKELIKPYKTLCGITCLQSPSML